LELERVLEKIRRNPPSRAEVGRAMSCAIAKFLARTSKIVGEVFPQPPGEA
jgi:hypothetical protein